MVLNRISLVISVAEPFFLYLLAIGTSSLENYVYFLYLFLNELWGLWVFVCFVASES